MNMQPFTKETVLVLLLGGLAYGVAAILPLFEIPLLDVVLKASVLTIIFGGSIWFFNLSPDVSQLANKAWFFAKNFFGR
jgi:hypothetical protein